MQKYIRYLAKPKYWPELLLLGILKIIALLPLIVQVKLGRTLGRFLMVAVPRRRVIAETNLKLCFPDKSEQERTELLKEIFALTGLSLIETAACWFSDLKSRKANTSLHGAKNLENALNKGKGVILLSFHLTSLEIGGCLLSEYFDICAMYKASKSPLFEDMMLSGRLRHIQSLITQDDARGAIRLLKKNKAIWYATDQNYGNKSTIFVPFFGTQASTVTATTKFAKLTGASVVPYTHKRSADGKHFELTLHPALDDFPGDSEYGDALRINEFLENYLRENPADYMWIHQRFRTRPPSEAPIYPQKK